MMASSRSSSLLRAMAAVWIRLGSRSFRPRSVSSRPDPDPAHGRNAVDLVEADLGMADSHLPPLLDVMVVIASREEVADPATERRLETEDLGVAACHQRSETRMPVNLLIKVANNGVKGGLEVGSDRPDDHRINVGPSDVVQQLTEAACWRIIVHGLPHAIELKRRPGMSTRGVTKPPPNSLLILETKTRIGGPIMAPGVVHLLTRCSKPAHERIVIVGGDAGQQVLDNMDRECRAPKNGPACKIPIDRYVSSG